MITKYLIMKKSIRYNLIITILQFLLFAALLFAVFFVKFGLNKKTSSNSKQGFVIEQNEY